MRTRNIKPSIFKNELLGTADPLLTLLFEGLWCLADCNGILEDRPLRIKAEVFPYRNVDCNELLNVLASMRDSKGLPLVIRYTSDGTQLLAITKFNDHQNPHPKEPSFGYPLPDIFLHGSAENKNVELGLPSFSLPPSPNPSSPTRAGNGKATAEGFDEFWSTYPRKESKADALGAWGKLKPDPTIRAAILEALSRQTISDQWTRDGGRYIPLPATYLNKRRWEDQTGKPVRSAKSVDEIAAEQAKERKALADAQARAAAERSVKHG